jgi:hypothetical protein
MKRGGTRLGGGGTSGRRGYIIRTIARTISRKKEYLR